MEPAIIDWKTVESRYARDEAYENISAPMWLDLTAPDDVPFDDTAWFCRPDCNHPKTAEDFKLSAMASPKAKLMRSSSERTPFGERNSNRRDENKVKRRGGLVAAPLLPASPLKPKTAASKAFKEDLENQDPNQSTPSRLPKPRNAAKEMIKSSAGKKVEEEREEPKPEKVPPRLKSTMSARNLFSGKDILSQISEFYHDLKRTAVGSRRTPVGKEAEEEVNKVAESPHKAEDRVLPRSHKHVSSPHKSSKLKIEIEKSTFPKDVRANPPTPQRFPSPRGVKNAKATANGRSPLNNKPPNPPTPERAVLRDREEKAALLALKEEEGCSNVSVAGNSGGTTADLFWFLKPCYHLQ